MRVTGRIVGMAEIAAKIRSLPDAVQGKVLLSTVRSEGKQLAEAIAEAAPRDPGEPDMADSIGVVTVEALPHAASVAVLPRKGPKWPHWFLWLFHEFGTSKMAAHPFIRPTWDARMAGTVERLLKSCWRRIQARMRRQK